MSEGSASKLPVCFQNKLHYRAIKKLSLRFLSILSFSKETIVIKNDELARHFYYLTESIVTTTPSLLLYNLLPK